MNLKRGDAPSVRDERLIDEHVEAKQREFLALLRPSLAPLTRFAHAMCRDKIGTNSERAKDLVSETILKAFESFGRVREPVAFQSYLFTIAVRLNRQERARAKRWLPIANEHFEIPSNSYAPDANADVENLYAALAKLPKKQREAIVMSEIAGLKLEEVARIQESSLSAVKSRVSRGRMKLAKLLGVEESTAKAFSPNAIGMNGSGSYNARFAFQAKEKI
jgi:RNA polymerase sigma-70 factor, ECF subfamily